MIKLAVLPFHDFRKHVHRAHLTTTVTIAIRCDNRDNNNALSLSDHASHLRASDYLHSQTFIILNRFDDSARFALHACSKRGGKNVQHMLAAI